MCGAVEGKIEELRPVKIIATRGGTVDAHSDTRRLSASGGVGKR